MARQVVAVLVFASQVVEPVERGGQGDDRRPVTTCKRGVDLIDHLLRCQWIAYFDRVEQSGHSGAEQDLGTAVDGAATLEAQSLQECRTTKIRRSNASRDCEHAAHELAGGKASVTPLICAVLPEPRRAASLVADAGRSAVACSRIAREAWVTDLRRANSSHAR